ALDLVADPERAFVFAATAVFGAAGVARGSLPRFLAGTRAGTFALAAFPAAGLDLTLVFVALAPMVWVFLVATPGYFAIPACDRRSMRRQADPPAPVVQRLAAIAIRRADAPAGRYSVARGRSRMAREFLPAQG